MEGAIGDELRLQETDFDHVLPLWRGHLWRGRKSPILATNPLCLDGTYVDDSIIQQEAFFWACYFGERLCGAISLLRVRDREFRVRGLIVLPEDTGGGVGRQLVESATHRALELNAEVLWSLPRESAWPFYQKMGFRKVSDWIEDKFEFGPNCFAVYDQPLTINPQDC